MDVSCCAPLEPPVMKFLFHIVILLGLFDSLLALPVPADKAPGRKTVSKFQWKNYLPILGTAGLLGVIGAITFIGNKADQAFSAIKKVQSHPGYARYLMLPEKDRDYVESRAEVFGQDLTERQKEITEFMDKMHGWPKLEMPDTTGLDKEAARELKAAYVKLDKAMKKVEKARENENLLEKKKDEVSDRRRKAQLQAAIIVATDWKEALNKAKGHSVT